MINAKDLKNLCTESEKQKYADRWLQNFESVLVESAKLGREWLIEDFKDLVPRNSDYDFYRDVRKKVLEKLQNNGFSVEDRGNGIWYISWED